MKKITLLLLWLFFVGVGMSQEPQKVGVYVTGEVNAGNKKIAGQKIVAGISANPDFSATERTSSFLSELAKDHDYKVNTPVNEARIIEIGRQFGLDYVVVAEFTEAMGELVISAKMMDVQGNTQPVNAENIVKVRQASDLMRSSEDIAKQLLDNLYMRKTAYDGLRRVLDNQKELRQSMQENSVVVEPAVQQDSAETLSLKSRPQRIGIKELVDNEGVLGNGEKIMLKGFIETYATRLSDYEVFDFTLPSDYRIGDSRVDCFLVVEVNGLSDGRLAYTAKLLDFVTGRVVGNASLIGNNELSAYKLDCEQLLEKLLVKNR